MQADLCVFIGRFQPFHNGHLAVVNQALALGEKVLIVIGSANQPRDPFRNPFFASEREAMIRSCLTDEENSRLICRHIEDSDYNLGSWVTSIRKTVREVTGGQRGAKISLIGHSKDNSSFYINLFRQWGAPIDVENYLGINATDFRDIYFGDLPQDDFDLIMRNAAIPAPVLAFLNTFRETEAYRDLVREYAFVQRYRRAWDAAPYAPTFVTTDACVIHAGHILLVQRKGYPGKGLWALPGGFLEQTETVETGTFRELKEETRIKVPLSVLKGSLVTTRHFDAPFRSARGRTITFASLIVLSDTMEQPKVRAADDAADCKWWALEEVTRDMLMEDHHAIIKNLTALI